MDVGSGTEAGGFADESRAIVLVWCGNIGGGYEVFGSFTLIQEKYVA
jgi:hypothetical protein